MSYLVLTKMENCEKKFSKIYDKYIEKIYRFVFVKVNSQETAEDITSKVFMRGWEVFKERGDEIKNLSAFLYQIARNLVIDHYREKGRTQIISPDFVPQMADPRTNIEETAIMHADLSMVKLALKDLKDDYQNVIIWHYLDGLSVREVSHLLDRSEEATRVLLHRALGALKERLIS
ncbi:sigma-70 family RNA polymerase sigma factor [Patescibacteria group bacterium]|nr:sigma-70 family RNA polymerase sigma factor [Patescibacteria group bacterium]